MLSSLPYSSSLAGVLLQRNPFSPWGLIPPIGLERVKVFQILIFMKRALLHGGSCLPTPLREGGLIGYRGIRCNLRLSGSALIHTRNPSEDDVLELSPFPTHQTLFPTEHLLGRSGGKGSTPHNCSISFWAIPAPDSLDPYSSPKQKGNVWPLVCICFTGNAYVAWLTESLRATVWIFISQTPLSWARLLSHLSIPTFFLHY